MINFNLHINFQNVGSQPPTGYFGPNALQGNGNYSNSPNESSSSQAYGSAWGYPSSPNSNSAATDPMAAWAAYYQYYQQQSVTPQQPGAAATPAAGAAGATQQAGQQDYSLAWVDYYRSLGMHAEAEAILKQASINGNTAAASTTSTTPSSTTTTTTSSSTATLQAQAAAWQNYGYAGYPGYPGYGTQQTQ